MPGQLGIQHVGIEDPLPFLGVEIDMRATQVQAQLLAEIPAEKRVDALLLGQPCVRVVEPLTNVRIEPDFHVGMRLDAARYDESIEIEQLPRLELAPAEVLELQRSQLVANETEFGAVPVRKQRRSLPFQCRPTTTSVRSSPTCRAKSDPARIASSVRP